MNPKRWRPSPGLFDRTDGLDCSGAPEALWGIDPSTQRVAVARALVASSTLAPTGEGEVRAEIAEAHDISPSDLDHLTSVTVPGAQPAAVPPLRLRRPVVLGDGLDVCGDHRDTPSIQGAMASGARTARAVLRALRPSAAGQRDG